MDTIHKVILTCKEASCLFIINEEKTITKFSRLRLLLHRIACSPCRRFMNQMTAITKAFITYRESVSSKPPYHLSSEKKLALQNEIDKAS